MTRDSCVAPPPPWPPQGFYQQVLPVPLRGNSPHPSGTLPVSFHGQVSESSPQVLPLFPGPPAQALPYPVFPSWCHLHSLQPATLSVSAHVLINQVRLGARPLCHGSLSICLAWNLGPHCSDVGKKGKEGRRREGERREGEGREGTKGWREGGRKTQAHISKTPALAPCTVIPYRSNSFSQLLGTGCPCHSGAGRRVLGCRGEESLVSEQIPPPPQRWCRAGPRQQEPYY